MSVAPPVVIAIIPARMGSIRFPGKAIASDTGTPLILHVVEAVQRASTVTRVIVASEDASIEAVCADAGVEHIMTRSDHPNGSSRIAEAAEGLEADVILNVQGDEPEIEAETIDLVVTTLLKDPAAHVSTAAAPLGEDDDPADPNLVKVVSDSSGHAIYFSRAAIPVDRDGMGISRRRHIGIYAYRPTTLCAYAQLEPTPLEQAEKLEQLRLVEKGYKIAVADVTGGHPGIDTPEQYADFVTRFMRS
ncbi:MAG: 3-deoxy-manno-octulosonate cytidylyltransferase [Phycisphaerae bacterium]|nr:3-deoxy-manno-octulosonate cytidylyltransferase [Phycisphaerae bacterium]MBT5582411.1 3-deoxy-manno-octulosonate cytidylyltransferase [Phycisphaerae bacterium]MBT5656643.1 3-deoxy-manno-octulosonate cytidylyltransferase [Phycisphaerae bacterium]